MSKKCQLYHTVFSQYFFLYHFSVVSKSSFMSLPFVLHLNVFKSVNYRRLIFDFFLFSGNGDGAAPVPSAAAPAGRRRPAPGSIFASDGRGTCSSSRASRATAAAGENLELLKLHCLLRCRSVNLWHKVTRFSELPHLLLFCSRSPPLPRPPT